MTTMTTKHMIQDWAGNVMFNGLVFDSFDDAWMHIDEFVNEDEHNDVYAIPC